MHWNLVVTSCKVIDKIYKLFVVILCVVKQIRLGEIRNFDFFDFVYFFVETISRAF